MTQEEPKYFTEASMFLAIKQRHFSKPLAKERKPAWSFFFLSLNCILCSNNTLGGSINQIKTTAEQSSRLKKKWGKAEEYTWKSSSHRTDQLFVKNFIELFFQMQSELIDSTEIHQIHKSEESNALDLNLGYS